MGRLIIEETKEYVFRYMGEFDHQHFVFESKINPNFVDWSIKYVSQYAVGSEKHKITDPYPLGLANKLNKIAKEQINNKKHKIMNKVNINLFTDQRKDVNELFGNFDRIKKDVDQRKDANIFVDRELELKDGEKNVNIFVLNDDTIKDFAYVTQCITQNKMDHARTYIFYHFSEEKNLKIFKEYEKLVRPYDRMNNIYTECILLRESPNPSCEIEDVINETLKEMEDDSEAVSLSFY